MPQPTQIALIDCGTNTFHLMIVELEAGKAPNIVHRTREFVLLGEDGLERIGEAPFQRALLVLKEIKSRIDEMGITTVKAFATAALRYAANGSDFVEAARESTWIEIEIIPGEQEAQLIYDGVMKAVDTGEERFMIMDIGGGSTEFIIGTKEKVRFKQSFPVGASILKAHSMHSEPITPEEITQLNNFLNEELKPLKAALHAHPVTHLIGASGAFETLSFIHGHETGTLDRFLESTAQELDMTVFQQLYEFFINSTLVERLATKGMEPNRAPMMVVAAILMKFAIDSADITQLTISRYAMKEGMMAALEKQYA